MGRLIRYELRKLFSSKLLYIITAIFTTRTVLQAIVLAFIENSSISMLVNSSLYGFFALYVLFLGAWIAPTFISPDYSSGGILPNVVSRGYSRIQVFLAKYISLIVFHVFAFVVSSAIGIIVGLPLVRDMSGAVMLLANKCCTANQRRNIEELIKPGIAKNAAGRYQIESTDI